MAKIKIGVIGGVPVDTAFGVAMFRKYGFDAIGKYISPTSKEMTRLSILEADKLTEMVASAARELQDVGVVAIVLYCNTMVGAIDVQKVRDSVNMFVVTPQDVYKKIAEDHNRIGLIAASPTSAANTEKLLMSANPQVIVVGYGNLEIVHDIEAGVSSDKIIEKHEIDKFTEALRKNKIKIIILGCTHFPYFYEELKHKSKVKIIEPSKEMGQIIKSKWACPSGQRG